MAINPGHMTYVIDSNVNQAGQNQCLITFNNYLDLNPRTLSDFLLEPLKPVPMDASNRTECLPGTHADILASMLQWTKDMSEQRSIYWINSPARVGKSAVATTLANCLAADGRLSAFLFFDQDDTRKGGRDPGAVIRTIAYQLGRHDPCLGKIIAAAIENTPAGSFPTLRVQFQQFIIKPLLARQSTTQDSSSSGEITGGSMPVVVVIDGLDNCGDPDTRKQLLEVTAEATAEFSSILRMIVMSRATTDIHNAFAHKKHIISHQLDVIDNYAGILTYLRHRARETNTPLSDEDLHFIAKRACGWFPWAIVAWPDMHRPIRHLEVLLKGKSPQKLLDELEEFYRSLLEPIGSWNDDEFVRDFRKILGVIITAKTPLSITTIDHLLGLAPGQSSQHTILRLRSVLFDDQAVRLLHPSLGSFLSNRDQCGRNVWFVDPVVHKHALAIHCLKLMNDTLKNNSDITSLSRLETKSIPEELAYACRYGIDHICDVEKDISLVLAELHIFLNQNLGYWFQAMRLLGKSEDTIAKLEKLLQWITVNFPVRNYIFELVRNAWHTLNNLLGYTTPKLPNPARLHELINNAYQISRAFARSVERPSASSFCILPDNHASEVP